MITVPRAAYPQRASASRCSFSGKSELAKALLYAINGVIDEKLGVRVGPATAPVTSDVLDYNVVMERFNTVMDWLARLYMNTLNVIHYMHDKYSYERIEMALHDREILRTMACGIAGLPVAMDSLARLNIRKYARSATCHNPDTWEIQGEGQTTTVEAVLTEIEPYIHYYKNSGVGITVSGGEPLLQTPFVAQLFAECKRRWGMHTALDTSGFGDYKHAVELLEFADLVLLDLKLMNRERHQALASQPNDRIPEFAKHLDSIGKPAWIRHVLVPGLTDEEQDLRVLGEFAAGMTNAKQIEILPYHRYGVAKWKQIGRIYPLEGILEATEEDVLRAKKLLGQEGRSIMKDIKCTIYDQSAHPTELAYALERVKEEHVRLRAQVYELETALTVINKTNDRFLAAEIIAKAEVFATDCESHADWEESELLPFVEAYYRGHGGPEITASAWMMEKDHEVASEFLRLFIEKARRLPEHFDLSAWRKTSGHLLQACYIYKDHFELEEEVLFSTAFRVLDEIDYLFS